MNTYMAALGLGFVLIAGSADFGPTDAQTAQDVADDAAAAPLMAEQAAECRSRFGADVQVFVLDGQHTVCRPRVLAGSQP